MNQYFRLDQVDEGQIYEIVSVEDEHISERTGAYKGMSVVILKKAFQSIVQFGYSQIEIETDLLKNFQVQPV